MNRKKSVLLTLRGFDSTAQDVALLIAAPVSLLGNRGEPVRPGVKTLLTRTYVQYSMQFFDDYDLCEMLSTFLEYLGGVQHLCNVQSKVRPEFSELHFDLPVNASDQSQEGYFSLQDIADIFELKATVSFGFF